MQENFRKAHFGLRHRLIAFLSARSNFTYTIRHGLAAGMRRKAGLGFLPLGTHTTEEERFLANLDLAGKTVYDIGGFEGVLTLFFGRKARQVITYEPNPRSYGRCVKNVELNRLTNVRVFNRGISSQAGELALVYDPLMPGAASANREISQQINSSLPTAKEIRIEVARLDDEIEKLDLPAPDFIKIDIEGMELPALQGMRNTLAKYRPALFIELHGAEVQDKIANAQSVLEFLYASGYRVYDVENRSELAPAIPSSRPPSHLYAASSFEKVVK